MSASDNKVIDIIMKYLYENTNGEIEHCYYNKWNKINWLPFEEIQKHVVDIVNIKFIMKLDYPEFSLNDVSTDSLLEIQKKIIDVYGFELVGDDIFHKEHLLCLYMGLDSTIDELVGKYDIIKIQRLWRGYDCRWKNPFLMIKS
jgi:hypothetical protein